MNMQMSELMMSSPHNFSCILYIFFGGIFMYFVYFFFGIFIFLLKHVKVCPHIKIYQSKHYSAFIQSGYKANFTFSYSHS